MVWADDDDRTLCGVNAVLLVRMIMSAVITLVIYEYVVEVWI